MGKKIEYTSSSSVTEQLQKLGPSELMDMIQDWNLELAEFGVDMPISIIFYGASAYGRLYEDERYPAGGTIPTPLNCLMALLHYQPNLKQLPTDKFERLVGVIAKLSQATQTILSKTGPFDWPDNLTFSPKKSLTSSPLQSSANTKQ